MGKIKMLQSMVISTREENERLLKEIQVLKIKTGMENITDKLNTKIDFVITILQSKN